MLSRSEEYSSVSSYFLAPGEHENSVTVIALLMGMESESQSQGTKRSREDLNFSGKQPKLSLKATGMLDNWTTGGVQATLCKFFAPGVPLQLRSATPLL